MKAVSEARLAALHPLLAGRVRLMAEILAPEFELIVVEGLRPWSQQAALYAKGRDAAGNVIDRDAVVTDAPPGHSWHQFALAADVAPENPDGTIDWNEKHPQWQRIQQVAESAGLVSGATFKRIHDAPHVQLTGRFPVSPDDEVRQLFKDGGTQAVWDDAKMV